MGRCPPPIFALFAVANCPAGSGVEIAPPLFCARGGKFFDGTVAISLAANEPSFFPYARVQILFWGQGAVIYPSPNDYGIHLDRVKFEWKVTTAISGRSC